jgi:hypothetical protein
MLSLINYLFFSKPAFSFSIIFQNNSQKYFWRLFNFELMTKLFEKRVYVPEGPLFSFCHLGEGEICWMCVVICLAGPQTRKCFFVIYK